MQIGKPLHTFVVEPLESPVPASVPDPELDQPEPVAPKHEPECEPQHQPIEP
jgi:hypothetical protein